LTADSEVIEEVNVEMPIGAVTEVLVSGAVNVRAIVVSVEFSNMSDSV
jgi:hypothetical protein